MLIVKEKITKYQYIDNVSEYWFRQKQRAIQNEKNAILNL